MELPLHEEYHKEAIKLNTGRNCLEYILRVRKYKKVYIPYYTCEVVLEPFKKLGVDYEFYHIGLHLEIEDKISLKSKEALLYINYFGLKQRYIEYLAGKFGAQLIVDNTQAFYSKPIDGVDSFYTCRKFFGVADGACLYTEKQLDHDFEQDESYDRMAHLLKRIDLSAEQGFADFRKADNGLDNQPIKKMSKLTQRMMQSIDYESVMKRRRKNYQVCHKALAGDNNLDLPLENDAVPMVYPYYVRIEGLRQKLIEDKIYIAQYWPNVLRWCNSGDLEYSMTDNIIPIPVDQRYGESDIKKIINIIKIYSH